MKRMLLYLFLISAFFCLLMDRCSVDTCWAAPAPRQFYVYVGTYTGKESKGIYLLELDLAAGKLSAPGLVAEAVNPSFLAIHPDEKHLYAVNEINLMGGQRSGAVTAFSIDPQTGQLKPLNQQASGGTGATHLRVDPTGRNILVANYGGGSVAALPIQADGKLKEASCVIQHQGSSINPQRQKEPHAHSIYSDAKGQFAYAADLGLDKIMIYRLDASSGIMTPNSIPFAKVSPGAGPRHMAFLHSRKRAYVINEMASTITAFECDNEQGGLKEFQTLSTLPSDFKGESSTAEIQIHPSGKFLYGSNRGHDSLALFYIDVQTGKLTPAGYEPTRGKNPRHFAIDPTGQYLIAANQSSNNLVLFRVNPKTGQLSYLQEIHVPVPVCVEFVKKQ